MAFICRQGTGTNKEKEGLSCKKGHDQQRARCVWRMPKAVTSKEALGKQQKLRLQKKIKKSSLQKKGGDELLKGLKS